jgi:hypothetical protein
MRILSCWLAITFAVPAWVSAQVTVPMSQYDYERTGANLQEWMLNPSNVGPTRFGKLFSRTVDDTVYALPLIVPNLTIAVSGIGDWGLGAEPVHATRCTRSPVLVVVS